MRISRPMAGMLAAITLATPAITLTAQTALADDATTTTTSTSTSTSTDAPTSTTDIPADVRDLLDATLEQRKPLELLEAQVGCFVAAGGRKHLRRTDNFSF